MKLKNEEKRFKDVESQKEPDWVKIKYIEEDKKKE